LLLLARGGRKLGGAGGLRRRCRIAAIQTVGALVGD
jgi:hypothetical protein